MTSACFELLFCAKDRSLSYNFTTLVPELGTQFDFKQATGLETLLVVPMNTLLLIKAKELKARRLQSAQHVCAAHSEGIDYTSAHLSPVKLSATAS